jgi:hypothetical protein
LSQDQKYCLFATEGPHDQAAISKLLQLSGFKKFDGTYRNLDSFWEAFVPKYPKSGDLYKRMNMPTILTSQTHSVAVYWGEGNNLLRNLIDIATAHNSYAQEIHAFGLFIDADNKQQPEVIAKKWSKDLRGIFPMLPEIPGNISGQNPKTGIYIFPDNQRTGALDTILVDCASIVYPDHKNGAIDFLNSLDIKHTKHLNAINKDKATVACIVSVLKPGMANTASIAQDEWISAQTADNNYLLLLDQFLKELLK